MTTGRSRSGTPAYRRGQQLGVYQVIDHVGARTPETGKVSYKLHHYLCRCTHCGWVGEVDQRILAYHVRKTKGTRCKRCCIDKNTDAIPVGARAAYALILAHEARDGQIAYWVRNDCCGREHLVSLQWIKDRRRHNTGACIKCANRLGRRSAPTGRSYDGYDLAAEANRLLAGWKPPTLILGD